MWILLGFAHFDNLDAYIVLFIWDEQFVQSANQVKRKKSHTILSEF